MTEGESDFHNKCFRHIWSLPKSLNSLKLDIFYFHDQNNIEMTLIWLKHQLREMNNWQSTPRHICRLWPAHCPLLVWGQRRSTSDLWLGTSTGSLGQHSWRWPGPGPRCWGRGCPAGWSPCQVCRGRARPAPSGCCRSRLEISWNYCLVINILWLTWCKLLKSEVKTS